MAKICGKWLIYLGIGLNFEKRPNYLGNDVDMWEMSQICGEMT